MSLDIGLEIDTGGSERSSVGRSFNITHNVAKMWREAGCYEALYESAGKLASEVVPILKASLETMRADPVLYRTFNPENGWGNYEGAVRWLGEVIEEFEKHPKATVWVWS
jgi:hypothetical protein